MSENLDLITLEEVHKKLEGINLNLLLESVKTEAPVGSSPYIDAAAVMAFYDPSTIMPVGKEDKINDQTRSKLVNELIGCSSIIADSMESESSFNDNISRSTGKYKILFSLQDEVRKQTLISLINKNRIHQALEANKIETMESKRPLQYLLTSCLKMIPIELHNLNVDELNALYKISEWLTGVNGIRFFSKQEIIDRIELLEMLRPFKHLTGSYEDGVFQEKFRGRHTELATLRRYVGVAPPNGIIENLKNLVGSFFQSDKKPLLIFGLGGVGKSTLLSKFILEHIETNRINRFPFVYLDFDRPNLSALEPETLLIEAARQLSIQYRDIPEISSKFSKFYTDWNLSYSTLIEEGSSEQISLSSERILKKKKQNKKELQSGFIKLVRELTSHETRPFLVVLDTFEEVQFKGAEFVNAVLDFFEEMQKKISKIRIVISGRSPIHKGRTNELELGDLDVEAAEGFILSIGITNPSIAKAIAVKIGGNPLTLKLAAELVKKYGAEELAAITTTKTRNLFLTKRLPEMEVQGVLYQRILAHLHNPEVKKLAHPGMVLRKITPELILKVLAGPCNLKNINTIADAQALFEEISKEVALVTKTEPYLLKHRSDVRKVMLKLIMQSDKKELAMQIHQLAVEYYSSREGILNTVEEFYHRLALGESPRNLESRWIDGMEDYLSGNRDELPEKAEAFILGKAGIESVDLSIWNFADVEDQNRHLVKQAANLLNSGMAESALQLLNGILHVQSPAITFIIVRALRQLERFSEAANISRQALNSFYSDKIPFRIKAELQRYATDEEMPGDNIRPRKTGSSQQRDEEDFGEEGGMTTLTV